MFVAGIWLFTLASLVGGFAPSAGWLIAARALQGVGAAAASPIALALIATHFQGPARAKAFGVYGAVSGAGGAVGLVLGGLLTQWASWRWVMFVNVPIGIAVAVLAPIYILESERGTGRFDLTGGLSSTIGVSALTYALIRVSSNGWSDPQTIEAFVVAVVLLAVFLVVETRARQPIMPLGLFAHRNRASANLILLLLAASMFGMFFFLTQFLQNVLGFTPIVAGFAFLPFSVATFVCAQAAPRLGRRLNPKPLLAIGASSTTLGMVWLTQLSTTSGYVSAILGPMVLFGIGVGFLFTVVTGVALADVEAQYAGAASGMLNVVQRVGGTLGLAVLVTVFGVASRNAAAHPTSGTSVTEQAHQTMTHGATTAFIVAAVFTASAVLLALFGVQTKPSAEAATT
jgi:EmrB/QacA subfamily drug resistance transporter